MNTGYIYFDSARIKMITRIKLDLLKNNLEKTAS